MSASATPLQNEHAMANWEPRRALTLDAARRHSAFIKFARRVLIALSVLLFALLMWYFVQSPTSTPQIDNPEEAVRMENPVYKGRTTDALPFKLMADYAVRLITTPDEVKLTNPKLAFVRAQDAPESIVSAKDGLYNSKLQSLELHKAVKLKTDDGYTCSTSHARIFVREKRIEGDEPIDCLGSFGQAGGNAYEINDSYSQFIFKNGMTARIIPNESDSILRGVSSIDDPSPTQNASAVSFGGDEPIDIIADKAIYRGAKTVLNGHVDVRQNDGKILSDNMDILRRALPALGSASGPDHSEGSQKYGSIQTIIATGNFKYITPKITVRGTKGVYERDKNTITVTGNVTYVDNTGKTASSDMMIYDLTTDAVRLDGGQGRIKITTE